MASPAPQQVKNKHSTSTIVPLPLVSSKGDDSVAFQELGRQPRQPVFRPAQPLTYELENHSKAYIEARQYAGGYGFLDSLLTSSNSISTPARPYPAFLAPAPQLALASTLIVYPFTTTRAKSADALKGSDVALRYLQHAQSTISPLHENFQNAYTFPDERSRRGTVGYRSNAHSPTEEEPLTDRLAAPAAGAQGLWYRATDFWHIVGWAFNCSVAHKRRWDRWKLWLELMLDFVEIEWDARIRQSREEALNKENVLMDSLIWRYISSNDLTLRSSKRRIIRAIFSMATLQSNEEFKQVWKDETLEPTTNENEKPLQKIDIENDQWGDFERDEEDIIMGDTLGVTSKPTRRNASGKGPDQQRDEEQDEFLELDDKLSVGDSQAAIERLGGTDAIQLRQRLIALMARVAEALPSRFTKTNEFCDLITEEYMRMPTIILSTLLSTSRLSGLGQMQLNANLLLPLVSGRLPDYTLLSPQQSHLEEILLPRRATTQSFAANAKLSIILEQMFMYMMSTKALQATSSLRSAVETGIDERGKVYGIAKGKGGNAQDEDQGKLLLQSSADRLLGLLEVIEIAAGKAPQPMRKISLTSSISELSSPPGSDNESEM